MRAGPASSRGLPTVRGARLREGLVQRGRPLASRGGEFEHGLVENQPCIRLASAALPARARGRRSRSGSERPAFTLRPSWVPRPRAGIPGQIRIVDPVETEPCYFGEAVDIYEGGEIVGHEGLGAPTGSGAPGIAPGIFVAAPEPGMSFQQEVARGVAEDQATIAGTGTVTLPDGTVAETITVRDFNPARWERSAKVYARNVGLVQDAKLNLIR